jgi:glycosyltransferase involved in cell wall biosynthesis
LQAEFPSVVFVWGKWLPYHFARVQPCVGPFREAGLRVLGVQYSDTSIDYKMVTSAEVDGFEFFNLRLGDHEMDFRPLRIARQWPAFIRRHRCRIVFVPSYWDWSFSITVVSRLMGCKVVMMNESHAGTQRATGWKKWVKRQMVKQFGAALVGGEPHKRHFASLGIPADKIFTGYDAVDNDFFASRADEIRAEAKKSVQCSVFSVQQEEKADEVRTLSSQRSQSRGSKEQDLPEAEHLSTLNSQPSTGQSVRSAYGLPQRYFLSLGRMVEKKNLSTLVEAYARFARASVEKHGAGSREHGEKKHGVGSMEQRANLTENCKLKTEHCPPGLVFVGSGELESALREQARALGLRVVDCTAAGSQSSGVSRQEGTAANCKLQTEHSVENDRGAVFFYGFRQIEENPVFYALAEAFVLPSLKEEWGLVVNEAMACSLPVIVSRTAGCAEDLLPGSGSVEHGAWSMEQEADARAGRSMEHGAGGMESGENADADDCRLKTENSLEQRSNGFIFDPTSVEALAEALRRLADDGELRQAMGCRSREKVEQVSCGNFARQALRAAGAAAAESQEG